MGQNQTVPKRYPKGTRLVIAGEWMILPHDLWKSEAPAPQKALRAPSQHPIWAEQKLKRSNTKAWFGMGYQYVSIPHRDRMSHNGNRPFAIFILDDPQAPAAQASPAPVVRFRAPLPAR